MIYVDKQACIGCGQCEKECYFGAVELQDGKAQMSYERCFKCGHCIAVCPKDCITLDDYPAEDIRPYRREEFDIAPDTLLNFVKFRRSARHFTSEQVNKDVIANILEIGRFTQTGGNQQNVSYIVIQEQRDYFRKIVLESLYALSGKFKNTADPVLKRYAILWKMFYNAYQKDPVNSPDKLFFNAPTLIVVTSPSPINAGLAAANIANMIDATAGLGTCFSGFAVRAAADNTTIKEFLSVQPGHEVVACLMVGHTTTKYLRTVPRKPTQINWL